MKYEKIFKKREKMMFSQSLSTFLSHIINEGGMKMNHSMVNRIRGQTHEAENSKALTRK